MWKSYLIGPMICLLASCQWSSPAGQAPAAPATHLEPLPVQQAKAYPETVTGLFVSLADFEDSPGGPSGRDQVSHFSILPASNSAVTRFEYNITRTGTGAMEVTLPPRSELVFKDPSVHNLSNYTLVSLALYSPALRDDLRVTLTSDAGAWSSPRTLVQPGWNTVLIDIQRLGQAPKFDVRSVRSMALAFVDSASPVTFNIDDIMLINNKRRLTPMPDGVWLEKNGLDYRLGLPGRDGPISISQQADGLWRLGPDQAVVQMAAPGADLPSSATEYIGIMGDHRVGAVEIIEQNDIRVRIANTWYFPSRQGEWASMAVRQIRWEYTFYSDGRQVVSLLINNSAGSAIGSLRILPGRSPVWASGAVGPEFGTKDFRAGVGRWYWLLAPAGQDQANFERNYRHRGKIVPTLWGPDVLLPGDADRDGFDESQGCYYLSSKAGHCRFTIQPPEGGLMNPVFRIFGRWDGPVSINVEGLSLRTTAILSDGSVLFAVPGKVTRPTAVEVFGKPAGPIEP